MANEHNLIPVTKRTKEEQRAISSKGGKASAAARRKRADLKRALDIILTAEVSNPNTRAMLEEMGLPTDNQTLLALSLFQKAVRGNVRASELIVKVVAEKDELDRQEQRERIKLLRHKNREAQAIDATEAEKLVFVDEWAGEMPELDTLGLPPIE
ncbi:MULTISPECIES: hypothetical protein [unclassified Streptococcus]|uniref:hypothetical protein n=1 Tax=unclassified Streptococcus TaxID=2608887 RepID=UPI00359EED96